MDHEEDVSARVLLKHIVNIEPPRTPIAHSASRTQSTSGTSHPSNLRRSSRLSKGNAVPQTAQEILRRNLEHKIQDSVSRNVRPTTRRTTAFLHKKANTPDSASVLFDDGDTPRHILKNILLTEPVKSPVVHKEDKSEVSQLPSANSSLQSRRPSMELSGLELSDITMGNVVSTVKGLSRKRPHRSLNVTAFEKRLKDGNDVEEDKESLGHQSSLSLSSSTSLSLKTPFVDIRTERKGLQRRVSNRRKITAEEFGAAVNKRQMRNDRGVTSFALAKQGNNDSFNSEEFTLNLSQTSLPDITSDIVHCNTALYAQTDAVNPSFLALATQDKPTVTVSQCDGNMEQGQLEREKSVCVFSAEEGILSNSPKDCVSTTSLSKKEVLADDFQPEDAELVSTSEEDEGMEKSQTTTSDDPAESENEGNTAECDSQTEEDVAARSQSEEEVFVEDTQIEEGAVESQSEEDDAATSQPDNEEDAESDQEVPVTSSQSEDVDSITDLQSNDDGDVILEEGDKDQGSKQLEGNLELIKRRGHRSEGRLRGELEHISRRAHRSEGGLIIRVKGPQGVTSDTGTPDENSKAHGAEHLHDNTDVGSGEISYGMTDLAKSSTRNDASCAGVDPCDIENTFHLSLTTESDSMMVTDAQDPEEEEREEEVVDGEEEEEEVVDGEEEEEEEVVDGEEGEEEVVDGEEEEVVDGEEEEVVNGEEEEEEVVDEEGMEEEMVDREGMEGEEVDGEEGEEVVDGEDEEEREEEVVDGEDEEEGEEEVVDGEEEEEVVDGEDEEEGEEEVVDGEEGEEEVVDGEEEEEGGGEEVVDWVVMNEEDEDEENEDIPMKTPAFVKEKRNFNHLDPLVSPVLKNIQSHQVSDGLPGAKPKPGRRGKTGRAKKEPGLPKSYLMAVFKHFAKTKVSADVYPVLKEIMDKFFDRLVQDLEAYALHARRKTIEVEDAELLLKRQGHVNDKVPVEVLIEKYLRMEQRKLLIPIATSGNVVIPKRRR